MPHHALIQDQDFAATGRLASRLIRLGRRLGQPVVPASATARFIGGVLVFTGVLVLVAVDVRPPSLTGLRYR